MCAPLKMMCPEDDGYPTMSSLHTSQSLARTLFLTVAGQSLRRSAISRILSSANSLVNETGCSHVQHIVQLPMSVAHYAHRCAIFLRTYLHMLKLSQVQLPWFLQDQTRCTKQALLREKLQAEELTSMTVGSCRKRAHTASRSFTAVCAGTTSFTASMPCHEASNSLLPRYVAHSMVTCIDMSSFGRMSSTVIMYRAYI